MNQISILAKAGVGEGVARVSPLEDGPEGKARLSWDGFIAGGTWSDYASRLWEYYGERGIDLTAEEVLAALDITHEDIHNKQPLFDKDKNDNCREYDDYMRRLKKTFRKQAISEQAPVIDSLLEPLNKLRKKFSIEDQDAANVEIEELQEKIKSISSFEDYVALKSERSRLEIESERLSHISTMAETAAEREKAMDNHDNLGKKIQRIRDELSVYDIEKNLCGIKIKSLESGTIVTLDQFIAALYDITPEDKALSARWMKALSGTVEEIALDMSTQVDSDVAKVPQIYVGAEAFDTFESHLNIPKLIWDSVDEKISFIRPAFYSEVTIRNHPLLTGENEK